MIYIDTMDRYIIKNYDEYVSKIHTDILTTIQHKLNKGYDEWTHYEYFLSRHLIRSINSSNICS